MQRLVLILTLSLALSATTHADPAPAFPPHTLAHTLLRPLPKTADGRSYQLHIRLPGSFAKEPQRRYPVLYVTDGYWDFPMVVSSYGNLRYDEVVPEMIIVGLGYAGDAPDYDTLRDRDLSPVPMGSQPAGTGHADQFLATLERDGIPLMEREYRADPAHRALAGSSLGGLFALYAMYAKPTLFEGVIAASPAVVVGND